MANPRKVLITAGGTQEQIDDIRYIGNLSSGRFGHALAQKYQQGGDDVTLLAPQSVQERFGAIEDIQHIPFSSAEDLRTQLLGCEAADLILHAAAVSDYTPDRTPGKISSTEEQLTITATRTPKILSLLRDHFGNETKIVGFKLLSDVSEEHLLDIATQQIATNATDYCIANRLEDIDRTTGERGVYLVEPSGIASEIYGPTDTVAQAIYKALSLQKVAA